MPGPLNQGRKGVAGTDTPTPVRATGTTERLSSHRADDETYNDTGFDRDLLSHEDDYRVRVTHGFGIGRRRSRRK